jgi:hypothetical protein
MNTVALRGMILPDDTQDWLPALIAFYRADCSFQRAENLAKGWAELDGYDRQVIAALQAAFEVAP